MKSYWVPEGHFFESPQECFDNFPEQAAAVFIHPDYYFEVLDALRCLHGETRGTLHAHELAIRYDSGNSNWECLEIALERASKILNTASGAESK